MTPLEIATARSTRITSTRIPIIMEGDYEAWNRLADLMRSGVPAWVKQKTRAPALRWGLKHEPRACGEFWFRHPELQVEDEPFRYWHDPRDEVHWRLCSTSPDRTIYLDGEFRGGVEAKCPYNPGIHRQYWSDGVVPAIYKPQFHWHMIVTDAPGWWFISYDPREEAGVNYWELYVERDHAYEAEMMAKVDRFIGGYLAGETFKKPTYNYEDIF